MAGTSFNPNFPGGSNAGVTTALAGAAGAVLNAGNGVLFTLTPTAAQTITASVRPAGSRATLIVLTAGVTSYVQTFGTGFKVTGTLATGTTTAKYFVLNFISDGSLMIEESRTAAM